MSKLLVIGDIHGRLCWLDIISKENPDKVIFLGDYVSSHDDISCSQQCSNLEDILNYKSDNPDKVILLRGNHDMQHLGYNWAGCSGFFCEVYKYMSSPANKERFLNNTQWVHIEDNILFSHAGVSNTWYKSLALGEPNKDNLLKINDIEPCSLFGFTPRTLSDFSGDTKTQPCTWIRPNALNEDCIDGWDQVVGHTKIYEDTIKSGNGSNLWFIDKLPSKYLVIENGKYNIKQFKEYND